ncbi:MAG: caspase family protein [Rubrivivax sp.]|jgi:uncharacterized caspase-like protein
MDIRPWTALGAGALLALALALAAPAPVVAQTAATVQPSEAEGRPMRRVALVVGNGGYRGIAPLLNSRNDAQDMCAALGRLGFETICLTDVPTRADFQSAVRQLSARLEPGAAALFYYAGHGVQVNGRNYLLPTAIAPTSSAQLEAESLSLDWAFAALKEGRAAVNIVILDACRDDPFTGGRGPRVTRGLAREEPPTGSVLVYATAPGATAADGHGRNGLFTSHLLAAIEKPGPQIGEMLRGVAKAVEQDARSGYGIEQVPYRSFSYSGVFCFASCDETRIAEQVEVLKQQRATAQRRIQELVAQNASLEAARAQTPDTDLVRRERADRLAEISALRTQLDELAQQASQLDAYRQRVAALEKQARDREQQLADGVKKEEARRSRPAMVPAF